MKPIITGAAPSPGRGPARRAGGLGAGRYRDVRRAFSTGNDEGGRGRPGVLGRLVPIEDGVMLEAAPLVVPERTARQVADDAVSWMQAVGEARDDIHTGGFANGLVADVRQEVWQYALCAGPEPLPAGEELVAHLARRTLSLARSCLDDPLSWGPDDVDPWACLRSALLDVGVLERLPAVTCAGDAETFDRLSRLLAPPADVVCRDLARKVRRAA